MLFMGFPIQSVETDIISLITGRWFLQFSIQRKILPSAAKDGNTWVIG
jgi:hypothetical protein